MVPPGPAAAPVVAEPDVVACIRQDEGKAGVREIVHPVTTIQEKPVHDQHGAPEACKGRDQVGDRGTRLFHLEIKHRVLVVFAAGTLNVPFSQYFPGYAFCVCLGGFCHLRP